MGVLTSKLILSLVDRVTAPARAVAKTMNNLKLAQAANNRQMAAMRGRMMDAAAMGYVLSRALSAPVKSAMAFESAMADVNKVVDFDSPDGLKQMSADILSMSKRIPIAATGIADIVAAAGQAGMKGGELLSFAEMAAKVGVAFDISADQAGESLAKIKTALGLSVEQTSALADAMNHLSNTSASAAPDLLDFMSRVGSIGKQYGFTEQQTVAIGSAMIAAGAKADVAATSFRNVGKALVRGKNATKGQRSAFKELGLDAKIVAKAMQKDAVGTLNDVIARIRKLPKELQAANISALFGDEARAIAPLISNSKLLADSLAAVSDETKYLGSSQKEFEVRSKTSENALQLFKNQMEGLSIAIGSALLPALTKILDAIGPIIGAMADWANAHPELTTAIVGITGSVIALNAAAIAMRFAFLFGKGGILSAATGVVKSAGKIAEGTRKIKTAILGAQMLSAVGGGGVLSGLVASVTSAVGAITGAVAWIGVALGAITAPIWGIIAAVVAAVAGVALTIYNYWVPISEFITGFVEVVWEALSSLVTSMIDFGAEMTSAVGSWAKDKLIDFAEWLGLDREAAEVAITQALEVVSEAGRRIVEMVKAIPQAVGNWISDIFTMNEYSNEAVSGFRNTGRAAGLALVEAVKTAFDGLMEWFKGLPGRVIAAIGKIDLSSLISWPSMPKIFGGKTASPAVAGARAAGGHVAGGSTYLVGELGQELVTPRRDSYVHSAQATKKILGGQNASDAAAGGSFSFGNIIIQGVQDPEAIAEAIDAKIREKLAGLQADLGYSGA